MPVLTSLLFRSKFLANATKYFTSIPNRVATHQHTLQHLEGPSFQRLGGSDVMKVGVLYAGVGLGVLLALRGQTDLWLGTNRITRD